MPLSERTERALEACHDAIIDPARWSSALQSLAESFGAASCTFFDHNRRDPPTPVPMSTGHEAFADLWVRNQTHAPDPHVGPYLKICSSFVKAGWASALEHDVSTEEERKNLPFFRETARPEKREWLAMAFFSVEGNNWCFPIYRGGDHGPFTPEDAKRLAPVGPYVARIVSLAQKFAAFDVTSKLSALASELCRYCHRCSRPRDKDDFASTGSARRRLQPHTWSSDSPRCPKQSPATAPGFACFACRAR